MATVAKEQGHKLVASNRRARHDYLIEDTYEAGLVLMGTEVKSLRQGRASLIDGFATVRDGELWLEGVHISARRRRKLLLNKDEIHKLISKTRESGHTIVPLSLYFKDGRAKVEIALAKGKRNYDKRQTLRERQDRREAERAMSTRRER
jgi:SsrA-binding protein